MIKQHPTCLKLSHNGAKLITELEGFRESAYKCSAGVWTIGIGTTIYSNGLSVQCGDVINKQQAVIELINSCEDKYAKAVRNCIRLPITQNQFDALVSLCYNIGCYGFAQSTLVKRINTHASNKSISEAFRMWNKAGGRILPGLSRRREREITLYFCGVSQSETNGATAWGKIKARLKVISSKIGIKINIKPQKSNLFNGEK